MSADWGEFERRVAAVLRRYCAQQGGVAPTDEVLRGIGARLAEAVRSHGLPRPLAAGECGAPGGMSDAECAPIVATVAGGVADLRLAEAARQLVKACLYPEFTVCRESYRETARDGSCRRQELARARGRTSGTHCVDCPYWVQLGRPEHVRLLADNWRSDPEDFARHEAVFLPEDFRALRQWLHAAARSRVSG